METNASRVEAASQGKNRFTGKPCRKCHGTDRYTINGGCVVCHNKRAALRQKRFRDKIRNLLKQAKGGQP